MVAQESLVTLESEFICFLPLRSMCIVHAVDQGSRRLVAIATRNCILTPGLLSAHLLLTPAHTVQAKGSQRQPPPPSPGACAGPSCVADWTGIRCVSYSGRWIRCRGWALCRGGWHCLSRGSVGVVGCQRPALGVISDWAGGGQGIAAKGYMVSTQRTNRLFHTPHLPLNMYPRSCLSICVPGTGIAVATR